MTYERLRCTLRLLVPAFLGDAQQASERRTPPLKHLLREWWRIGEALATKRDHARLRDREGALFGDARDACAIRSRVTLSLRSWAKGTLEPWPTVGDAKVLHPEVDRRRIPDGMVSSQLYLGFGPLVADGGRPRLKVSPAIRNGDQLTIALRAPMEAALGRTIKLWHAFGCLGGRSRNGWGSFEILDERGNAVADLARLPQLPEVKAIHRPWRDCLELEWSHALGADDEGNALLWRTKATLRSWQEALNVLASVKIAFRTALPIGEKLSPRHLLAMPVTHHEIRKHRLANQLRFKVLREGDGFRGIALHLPHGLPADVARGHLAFPPASPQERAWQESAWTTVHAKLDAVDSLMERWT